MASVVASHATATTSRSTNWNRRVLAGFAPFLIVIGVAGFVLPPVAAPFSSAGPYNAFHIAAGLVGAACLLTRRMRAIAGFNLGFGAIDLYQALAGVAGWFPADLFGLRAGDHVAHVGLGLFLVVLGGRGLRG